MEREMCVHKVVSGGITAASGFRACGVHAGIKGKKPDMALIVSERPAAAAAVFTTNRVQAAPVLWCRERLKGRQACAVVINSGNANACTGEQGRRDTAETAAIAAKALGLRPEDVWVCSTGTIGIPLPMDKIRAGIGLAVSALVPDGGDAAARAIMTTDTVDKQAAVELTVDGATVRVGGMAKGAGMIEPNMATMLGFLTTDAAVDADALQACLAEAVKTSFNRITIDGDRSTNDTVIFMANGAAGNRPLNASHPDWNAFRWAVAEVTRTLALKVVADGEGVTKVVTVDVTGARSDEDAARAARAIANSLLVKTAWHGGDPNWGRIMAAVGYSGADVDPERVNIRFDDADVVRDGRLAPGATLSVLETIYAKPSFAVKVDLRLGGGRDTVYTCDCSEEYVRINSEYMT
jgi:glutamate N-acetyltransferase/amino-acid N-acetyltransferase